MIRVEHSVVIQAPVEQVFRYTADYQKWPEWYEGVSHVTPTTVVSYGNRAPYAYKVRVLTVSVTVETEIHDFVQNQGWTGISTGGIPHTTTWIFEPIGSTTKFTHAVEGHMPIPLLGSLCDSWFLRPQWIKIVRRSLNNLTQRVLTQTSRPA
jgi:uncharacterized membrane protein